MSNWMTNQTWASDQEYAAGIPEISIGYSVWNESPDQVYLNSTEETFQFAVESLSFGQLN